MSYTRRGPDSDVYVYWTSAGRDPIWVCFDCSLGGNGFEEDSFGSDSREGMLKHLEEHVAAGDKVGGAIVRLRKEIA